MQFHIERLIKPKQTYKPPKGPFNKRVSIIKPILLEATPKNEIEAMTSLEIADSVGKTPKQITNGFIKLRMDGVNVCSRIGPGNIKRYWIN